jgi:hypothetical protein
MFVFCSIMRGFAMGKGTAMDRDEKEIAGGIGVAINQLAADSLQEQGKQPKPRGLGRRFPPGQSGNPLGRRRSSRNRATLMAEALLSGQAEELVQEIIAAALDGDALAQRLCLERILAPRRLERVQFAMPALASVEDAGKALAAIAAAVAKGDLAPAEAGDLAALVQSPRDRGERIRPAACRGRESQRRRARREALP